jgi:hypothetical protein
MVGVGNHYRFCNDYMGDKNRKKEVTPAAFPFLRTTLCFAIGCSAIYLFFA